MFFASLPRCPIDGRDPWASESISMLVDAVNLPVEMASRDALIISGLGDHAENLTDQGEQQSHNQSRARLRYQSFQLEELRKRLPPQDPFLAEVLDNGGLLAIRLGNTNRPSSF